MLSFLSRSKMSDQPEASPPATKSIPVHPLDALTGGIFSAQTSSERAQRARDWLDGNPQFEQVEQVHQALAERDKGAAKPLREWLQEQPGVCNAMMSGSGAAVFAVCDSFASAAKVATDAQAKGWWARTTTFGPFKATLTTNC